VRTLLAVCILYDMESYLECSFSSVIYILVHILDTSNLASFVTKLFAICFLNWLAVHGMIFMV
jgi:hypothetical protein